MKTILVIEDNPFAQDMLCEILESHGLTVVCANDGMTGLQKAKEQLPDLIISDIQMPNLDGLELLEMLRQDPLTESIPIIICTSATNQYAQSWVLQMGATAYLPKPFNVTQLMNTVAAQLDSNSAASAP